MVMVLPSLVLLIDVFDVISVMHLFVETRRPGQIPRSKGINPSSAFELRRHALAALSLRAVHSLDQWNLFCEMLQYQPDRFLLGLVTQAKPGKVR
jgi:hypothetical protein